MANRGKLRWMVVEGAVKAPDLVRFLRRLVRDAGRKVFLVLDRLKVHRARLTRDWLAEHRAEIEVVYLPSYSPEPSEQCSIGANFRLGVVKYLVIPGGDAARILGLARGAMA